MENKNVKVKLSTENYDIVDSGSVVLHKGEALIFDIVNLKFQIRFIENKDEQDGKIQRTIINEGTKDAYMQITFYNQHKAFFSSVSSLASMATLDNRHLYLKFSIQAINNNEEGSDKIFFYTWYLDKISSIQSTTNASV